MSISPHPIQAPSSRSRPPGAGQRFRVRQERILLAVTEHEKRMFLSEVDISATCLKAGAAVHETNPEKITREYWEELLRDIRPTVLVSAWNTPPLPVAWLTEPDPSLRYVCHLAGTVRNLVPRAFLERGGLVTNWGGLIGEAVAEQALLLALATLRKLPRWRPWITATDKRPGLSACMALGTRSLRRRSVGIHGFGHVARALVDLLKPFQADVAAFSPGVPPELMRARNVVPARSPGQLAARSEVFFECEALTPDTAGSIDADVLDALPDNAVFVNVGRGAVVDEAALLAAARAGRIQVAADVLRQDPIPADSPFLELEEAIISPHIAGPTSEQFADCGRLALANLQKYLLGEIPESSLSLNVYDRAT
ncbi:hydroxyacid dehydrogenase [Opitutaceae bacterium TAV5]|nr:hydroxyacid dehydrogenase [Opitutaceae bacterium TAV5]